MDRQAASPGLAGVFDDGSLLILDERIKVPPSGFAESRFELTRHARNGAFLDSAGSHYYQMYARQRA